MHKKPPRKAVALGILYHKINDISIDVKVVIKIYCPYFFAKISFLGARNLIKSRGFKFDEGCN